MPSSKPRSAWRCNTRSTYPPSATRCWAWNASAPSSMVNPPNDNPNLTPYPYDPAKAEELLDAAGYPRGDGGVRFESRCKVGAGVT